MPKRHSAAERSVSVDKLAEWFQSGVLGPAPETTSAMQALDDLVLSGGTVGTLYDAAALALSVLSPNEANLLGDIERGQSGFDQIHERTRDVLEMVQALIPRIAEEQIFDWVVQTRKQVRGELLDKMRDGEGRFDAHRFEDALHAPFGVVAVVSQQGGVRVGPVTSGSDRDALAVARIDLHSADAQKRREALHQSEVARHQKACDDFSEDGAFFDVSEEPSATAVLKERANEDYWTEACEAAADSVFEQLLEHFRVAYKIEGLGQIAFTITRDGEVAYSETTRSPQQAEELYLHAVRRRSDRREIVQIESGQPCKVTDACFDRTALTLVNERPRHRESTALRWRQFWARPPLWSGPTRWQLLALAYPMEAPDVMPHEAPRAAQICGVPGKLWRAWAADNSNASIPYTAWQLLLAHADALEEVGPREKGVSHGE